MMFTREKKVGFYCWAGPGTVRMTDLKFFRPKKDLPSLMGSYEYDFLAEIREKFGVTDFWATWSWGFSDAAEAPDRRFLEDRLGNFRRAGIRVHAYVQGPNLVRAQFPDADHWCRDERGRTVPYHRGRLVCCPNKPAYRKLLLGRIVRAARCGADGVFMDNVQVGKLGAPFLDAGRPAFAGCACAQCRDKFRRETGRAVPTGKGAPDADLRAWYAWRAGVSADLLREAADLVHREGKLFGSNSFDPLFPTGYCYGTAIAETARHQDYVLFENLRLPRAKQGNADLVGVVAKLPPGKDVFVVSYKRGIGHDAAWSQGDVDRIFAEADALGFHPCLKGSEFLTRGRWHNLRTEKYAAPSPVPGFVPRGTGKGGGLARRAFLAIPGMRGLLERHSTALLSKFFESRALRAAFKRVESLLMR